MKKATPEPITQNGWVCPSHLEAVWDTAGNCPRCGATLEPTRLFPAAEKKPRLDLMRRRLIGMGLAIMSALVAWACGVRRETGAGRGYLASSDVGRDSSTWSGWGMMGGGGMRARSGMMGGMCPMCGQPWRKIPDKLPTPKSEAWLADLRDVLSLERLSLVQYQADEDKYQVHMPYMMVIPQEELHIRWISELFAAYGLSSVGPTPAVRRSTSLNQAYEIAFKLEADLIPRYEKLVNGAEDPETAKVLQPILHQTRMHYMMFSHALRMGGMGPGMMYRR